MLGEVWEWAGKYRRSNKNIGVDKFQISIELRQLIEDALYWIKEKTFEPEELAIRFSHRIVKIHAFPNGNGRHSRLIADIIISHVFDLPVFTWGKSDLSKSSNIRKDYLNSIYEADNGNIQQLLNFSRK